MNVFELVQVLNPPADDVAAFGVLTSFGYRPSWDIESQLWHLEWVDTDVALCVGDATSLDAAVERLEMSGWPRQLPTGQSCEFSCGGTHVADETYASIDPPPRGRSTRPLIPGLTGHTTPPHAVPGGVR